MQVNGIITFAGIGFLLISGLGFAVNILIAIVALRDSIDLNTSNAVNQLIQAGLLYLTCSGIALGTAYITFYAGLKIIGLVKSSMLLNIEPIFTIALSVVIFGEQLSFTRFLGAGLVISGIFSINYKYKLNLQKP